MERKAKMTYDELHHAALYHLAEGPTSAAQVYAILALAEAIRLSQRSET